MMMRCGNIRYFVALAAVFIFGSATVLADAPAGYYATVDLSSPAALRTTVNDVIDGHTKIPYTSSSTDTWNVLEIADQDPYNSTRILDVYQNRTFPKHSAGNNDYNREHTWPNSYGFPDDGSSNMPYTDCHHLFLCDIDYNGARGNLYYDDCTSGCATYTADFYDGEGGTNRRGSSMWQTWDGRKGDVARAMFYMDVRYDGVGSEPDLILTDNPALIVTSGGSNASVAYMGLVSTLFEWHLADPVDAREMAHNDAVYIYQGNRNPFVDHPEWANVIFGDGTTAVDQMPLGPLATIRSAYPNPFNPSTTVAFSLVAAGRARVEIFSLDGRLVSTLFDGQREAGDFDLRWEGRTDDGRTLSSGAFVCRILAGGTSDTRTLLLLQ